MLLHILCLFLSLVSFTQASDSIEEDLDLSEPTRCELCLLISQELVIELDKQIRLNAQLSSQEPETSRKSHLDASVRQVCANMYSYELQSEDKAALRYQRNTQRNMERMANMLTNVGKQMNKMGLQKDIERLIDPTGHLKVLATKCQELLRELEEDITTWFFYYQENTNLTQYLCAERAVKDDSSCLSHRIIDVEQEKNVRLNSNLSRSKSKGKRKQQERDEVKLEHIEL
ncbi:protein canopy homolog 4-like [Corticium candelabrum]|uniref:protein canopy homolog 4-like n=1 Tax=Corticium candelabrum TaxID=121492 RepID=UPI002E27314A|nr:protein canopy homolog 4-like [Corticium candelabrum]